MMLCLVAYKCETSFQRQVEAKVDPVALGHGGGELGIQYNVKAVVDETGDSGLD